jgi:hypothetical protein
MTGFLPSFLGGIGSLSFGAGNTGSVMVSAGYLSIINNAVIESATFGHGNGGNVSVTVDHQLTMDGAGGDANSATGIVADSEPGSTGNAGDAIVKAGALSISNFASISSATGGTGNGGQVTVTGGTLSIVHNGGIVATHSDPETAVTYRSRSTVS